MLHACTKPRTRGATHGERPGWQESVLLHWWDERTGIGGFIESDTKWRPPATAPICGTGS
jgi:hypothetical protein